MAVKLVQEVHSPYNDNKERNKSYKKEHKQERKGKDMNLTEINLLTFSYCFEEEFVQSMEDCMKVCLRDPS